MDQPAEIDILNELLASEQRSLPVRVSEATVFVSKSTVEGFRAVEHMAENARTHAGWLSEFIIGLGGVPGPRTADAASADLHYLELGRAVPRLIRDHEGLITKYELAAGHLNAKPEAAELIDIILIQQCCD